MPDRLSRGIKIIPAGTLIHDPRSTILRVGVPSRRRAAGCDLTLLCFETLGGFSAEVVDLLHELARERDNKLTPAEYEETTWSARTWTTFAAQKISVALHYAAAFEISMALRVPKFDQAELDAAAARRMAGGG